MTYKEQALSEPRKVMGESSWDVRSNYYFCPTLCRDCEYFSEEESNWPYHCKAPGSDAPSHRSKKEDHKQYDDCKYYKSVEERRGSERQKEHEKANLRQREEDERRQRRNDQEERERLQESERERKEREREERQREREAENEREQQRIEEEAEYKRTHCFICGQKGILTEFYGENAHEKCFAEFKESEKGKKWVQDKEIAEEKCRLLKENEHKLSQITNKYSELLTLSLEGMKTILTDYKVTLSISREAIFIDKGNFITCLGWKGANGLFVFSNEIFNLFVFHILGMTNIDYKDYLSSKVLSDDEINQFAQFMEEIFQRAKLQEEADKQAKIEKEKAEEKERILAEQERILAEKEAINTKAKKRLQRIVKLPVFFISVIAMIMFYLNAGMVSFITFAVVSIVHYKLLTFLLNAIYNVYTEEIEKGLSFNKMHKFLAYSGGVIISTLIYIGILFLIDRFVFGMR